MKILLNNMTFSRDLHKVINIFYPKEKLEFLKESDGFDFKIEVGSGYHKFQFQNKEAISKYSLEDINDVRMLQRNLFIFLRELTGVEPPYGFMIGIRPSKIAIELIKKGYNKEQVIKYYEEKYYVKKEKAELCYQVALLEGKYLSEDKSKISVYIGMPFCPTRCSYCSFASNPIKACSSLVMPYLRALQHEIEVISSYVKEKNLKVQCIYFGGGTPTSVNEDEFEYIMKVIHECISMQQEVEEYTVECGRPDSITEAKLLTMKKYGVHRISINPQTMNEHTLKRIGRGHSVNAVVEKFNVARELGFNNINMDIIVGLPGESVEEINNTCKEILKLQPESLTVHGMALKRASELHEKLLYSDEDVADKQRAEVYAMYEGARRLALDLDMSPYYMYRQKNMFGNMENVGYCKDHRECIYNIQMIEERQTIVALGADAISKIVNYENRSLERCPNVKDVKLYIDRIDEMIEAKISLLNKLYE